MPFDFNWYDEKHTIIQITVRGQPTWDEYHQVMDKVAIELAGCAHRIDMVLDDKVGMPRGNPLPHLKTTIEKLIQYPNLGMTMAVSARNIALFPALMMETAARLYGVDLQRYGRFLQSMDEAVTLIMADRAKTQSPSPKRD